MPLTHLALPATQIGSPTERNTGLLSSGFSFIYNTGTLGPKSPPWKGLSVKAADRALVPILYTAGYLPACKQNGNLNQQLLATTPAWGAKGSVVRLPRVVSFPANALGGAAQSWVNTNATWLVANQIAIVQLQAAVIVSGGAAPQNLNVLESGLPLTGVAVVNEGAFLGDYAVGTVDPASFVAGSCFEIRKWERDYTDNGDVSVGFHQKQAAADIATNQAIYPRFAKRRVVTYGAFGISPDDTASEFFYSGLLNQLASYGFDTSIYSTLVVGNSEPAFFTGLVPQIKAFFGVP